MGIDVQRLYKGLWKTDYQMSEQSDLGGTTFLLLEHPGEFTF